MADTRSGVPSRSEAWSTAADLRSWALGWLALEASVELLIRACGGRFSEQGHPWILQDQPGRRFWLDAAAINRETGCLSGGERRVLAVVQALATGCGVWDLGGVLAGVDRKHQALILAAMAHAGGTHEPADWRRVDDGYATVVPLGSLFPWPADTATSAVR